MLKRTAELLLSRWPVSWAGRLTVRGRGLILAYHNVVPNGARPCGEAALHLPVGRFAAQLDCLLRYAIPVSLDALLGAHEEGCGNPLRKPLIAVTFDDAYRGALTLGVAELTARGIPATAFVSPGLLGDQTFWWDGLAGDVGDALKMSRVRNHALDFLGGRQESIRAWAADEGIPFRHPPAEWRSATESEVAGAVALGGITVGSHSWSHPSLPALSEGALHVELSRPVAWLRDRFSQAASWMAYPYGRASARVARAALQAGCRGALLVDGGWLGVRDEASFDHPRLSVPSGLSQAGFQARLSGFLERR